MGLRLHQFHKHLVKSCQIQIHPALPGEYRAVREALTGALHALNVKPGSETVLPGTLGMGLSNVSPDGRNLAGLSAVGQTLLLYDRLAGTTRHLAEYAEFPGLVADGKYIYYWTLSAELILWSEKTGIFRVKVADASFEPMVPTPAFPVTGNWDWSERRDARRLAIVVSRPGNPTKRKRPI